MHNYNAQQFVADYKMVYLILIIPEVWFWTVMVKKWKRRRLPD